MSGTDPDKTSYFVGVISDTHGRLPQAVSKVFQNTDLIVHAGDVGGPEIIDALEKIAPTRAVRGNMDSGRWTRELPANDTIEVKRRRLCAIHDVYDLDITPPSDSCDVVIFGHTHRPLVEKRQGVLYLNPGSAVHPRFGYPPSVALLELKDDEISARLIDLSK